MRRDTLDFLASFAVVQFSGSAAPAEQGGEAVEHSVTVDGLKWKYLIFDPKGFDKRLPMVMALHGGGSNPRQIERYTRFNALAERVLPGRLSRSTGWELE